MGMPMVFEIRVGFEVGLAPECLTLLFACAVDWQVMV